MAIRWYFGLARMLALAGVDINDVYDIVSTWLAGERSVRIRNAVDDTTGLRYSVLYGVAPSGQALKLLARVIESDFHIVGASPMSSEERAAHEKWEAEDD